MRRLIFIAVAAALLPAGASATEEKKEAKDPNRIVCEKQRVLGSRLAVKRVCMTAAEWAIQRAAERQLIDKSQTLQRGPDGS